MLYSVSANSKHGLRRTNADKRKAVKTLLNDEEWSQWSNNGIANQCGVSHTMVNNMRGSLETDSSQKRKGADGRTIDTSNIGNSQKEYKEQDAIPWDQAKRELGEDVIPNIYFRN